MKHIFGTCVRDFEERYSEGGDPSESTNLNDLPVTESSDEVGDVDKDRGS